MELFDTHTHLNAKVYRDKLEEVIKDAHENQVRYMNVVGFDHETNGRANEIAMQYDGIYATAGLHPTDAHLFGESDVLAIEEYIKQDITVAVGECGLDYYWQKDTKQQQKEIFQAQIELAKTYQKPIIVHMRDATMDTYEQLKEATKDGRLTGVMHSFSGSAEMALKFLDLGLYISLAGPVTFKNARTPKEVAEVVPIDRLLIETDCPYLTPHPYRGKENRPGLVHLVAETIAEIKQISIEELAQHTTENAKRLFQIK